jgi:hypothetical protein
MRTDRYDHPYERWLRNCAKNAHEEDIKDDLDIRSTRVSFPAQ